MTTASRTMPQQRRQAHHNDTAATHRTSDTVTVYVPLAFRQCRGHKVLVAPDGTKTPPSTSAESRRSTSANVTAAVRAFARAFRWRRLLETGAVATVHEIASAENINPSYVSRVLRLTLLSPEIVEAVMAETHEVGAASLDSLMRPFLIDWGRQTAIGN